MQAEEFRDITYTLDEQGIATLAFNTPQRKNAMSGLTCLEIWWAVDHFEKDDSAFVLILTGTANPDNSDPAKQAFCSGGYFNPDAYEGLSDEVMQQIDMADIAQKRLTLKLFQCDKPVLAAVNGLAIGGGATLTLAGADQVYLSEHAWLQFPFASLGLCAELASTYLLPQLLGLQKAKQVLFFPERISAQETLALGLCNAVLPHDELMSYTRAQAARLIPPNGALQSIRAMKRALHAPRVADLSAALELENEALNRLFRSADFAEGMSARIERRPAVFSGK
jgi:enoyl-CoA hydratase/carnithine racemase